MSPENFHEDLVRKTSRVILHAAERDRGSLVKLMTAKNAEKMSQLLKEKPIFWENDENSEQRILLDPEIAELMPQKFFDNPTQWIEAQSNIERHYGEQVMPTGETIEELWDNPYDISKVKEFILTDKDGKEIKIISKRINED